MITAGVDLGIGLETAHYLLPGTRQDSLAANGRVGAWVAVWPDGPRDAVRVRAGWVPCLYWAQPVAERPGGSGPADTVPVPHPWRAVVEVAWSYRP